MSDHAESEYIPPAIHGQMVQDQQRRIQQAIVDLGHVEATRRMMAAKSLYQFPRDDSDTNYSFDTQDIETILRAARDEQDLSVKIAIFTQISNIARFTSLANRDIITTFLINHIHSAPSEIRQEATYQKFFLDHSSDVASYKIFDAIDFHDDNLIYHNAIEGHTAIDFNEINDKVLEDKGDIIQKKLIAYLQQSRNDTLLFEALEMIKAIEHIYLWPSWKKRMPDHPQLIQVLTQLTQADSPVTATQAAEALLLFERNQTRFILAHRENGESLDRVTIDIFPLLDHAFWRVRGLAAQIIKATKGAIPVTQDLNTKLAQDLVRQVYALWTAPEDEAIHRLELLG